METLEREREEIELRHSAEVAALKISLEAKREELVDAYELLNMFREFVHIRTDDYWGNIISIEQIYGREHPEIVARIMEYFDLRTKEDEEDA